MNLLFVAAQRSARPTGGSFKQFSRLKAGSVKAVLSRSTHQRVTQAVGRIRKIQSLM